MYNTEYYKQAYKEIFFKNLKKTTVLTEDDKEDVVSAFTALSIKLTNCTFVMKDGKLFVSADGLSIPDFLLARVWSNGIWASKSNYPSNGALFANYALKKLGELHLRNNVVTPSNVPCNKLEKEALNFIQGLVNAALIEALRTLSYVDVSNEEYDSFLENVVSKVKFNENIVLPFTHYEKTAQNKEKFYKI